MFLLIIALLLVREGSALPGLIEGSGDFDMVDSVKHPVHHIPSDDEVLDPIGSEDGLYPEDDDDYDGVPGETASNGTDFLEEVYDQESDTTQGPTMQDVSVDEPVRIDLLGNFAIDDGGVDDANGTVEQVLTDFELRKVAVEEVPPNCAGYKKLPVQPKFVNHTLNVIRKCCPPGESFTLSDKNQGALCKAGQPWGNFLLPTISAAFYEGCIEDLEVEPPPALGIRYGNPCIMEGGLIRFSVDTKDVLFVIQNGSLLVINELVEEFDIFNSYCLDVDGRNGTLNAYVCPSEIRIGRDIFKGQMVALALCLIFAIPLLLATAYLYVAIPQFNDIHGKALALNCVNFAIALLLECVFQHKSKGNGFTDDTIVLANYAEYFILATFFWLLVNCMNNCMHAWYFLPKGVQIRKGGEKRTFALYAAFAQLVPLAIILMNPPNGDSLKHYFFVPIIVIIVLNMISFIITFWGFHRVSDIMIQHFILRGRLSNGGEAADAALANLKLPEIQTADVEKVKYMTKYTALLFVVMSGVWSITIGTYYTTQTIPILYDILFGLQGILIFIIFICLPRPFRSVRAWVEKKGFCGCKEDPDAVHLRRHNGSYRASNGTREQIPLNNVTTS